MTRDQVQAALDAIAAVAEEMHICAEAHELEDKLHRNVLQAIAEGKVYLQDAPELAELALSSLDIKFTRYYS